MILDVVQLVNSASWIYALMKLASSSIILVYVARFWFFFSTIFRLSVVVEGKVFDASLTTCVEAPHVFAQHKLKTDRIWALRPAPAVARPRRLDSIA